MHTALQDHYPRVEDLLRGAAALARLIDAPDTVASADARLVRVASDTCYTAQPLAVHTTKANNNADKPPAAFPCLLAAFLAAVPPAPKKNQRPPEHDFARTEFLQRMPPPERAALKRALGADVDALTATVRGAVSALTFDGAPLPSSSTTTDATRAALDALHEAASAQLAALKLRLAHLDRAQDALDLVDTGVRALEAFAQAGGDAAIFALLPPPTRKNVADAALKTQRASNNNNNNKRAKH